MAHYLVTVLVVVVLFVPSFGSITARADTPSRVFLPVVYRSTQPTQPSTAWRRPAETENWLTVLNSYRDQAGLEPVQEDLASSEGCQLHARYIVETGIMSHSQDPTSRWYSPEGNTAAQNSVLSGSYAASETDRHVIEGWLATVFHALDPLSPQLQSSGFGAYSRGTDLPGFERPDWAACLNVLRGQTGSPSAEPILWPPKDGIQPFLEGRGEWPDPLGRCGYEWPVGGYVIVQAAGAVQPGTAGRLSNADGRELEACVYDQHTFGHPDEAQEAYGRASLERHRAVVLIPRHPLTPGRAYDVALVVNGVTHAWSFTAGSAPQTATVSGKIQVVSPR